MNELNACRLSCFLGNMWLGAIMYADDLILISGSVKQMHNMLEKCAVFDTNMDLTFNVKNLCITVLIRILELSSKLIIMKFLLLVRALII